jgi:RNA polymerase sigma-70 factor (ECF subfamily)
MDDSEVMARVREGRVEMLAILFERHHRQLFSFFLRLTRQRGISEDLVQDVFLRVLKYRQSFRPESPFLPWMYRIARNAHMNHLRCQRPELSLDQQLEDVPDAGDMQDLRLERADHEDLLKVALERLPIGKREVLLLSRRPDLSYKDLAELLECTVGSVKVQVHRALKDLRKTFLALQGGTP